MSLALPARPSDGPPAVDFEGKPIDCSRCPARAPGVSARCTPGHACANDRYAMRIDRFFRYNPLLAEDWLAHRYFEVRAIAVRFANVFRVAALADDPDETVRASVAMRVPQTILRKLMRDPDREVRIRVAQRLAPATLPALLADPDYYVRTWVARRIPPRFLPRLAADPEREVRRVVATRLAPGALGCLLADRDALVRRAVAERAPDAMLRELADDASWQVRWEVARRAPLKLAELMAEDPDEEVRDAARERLGELRAVGAPPSADRPERDSSD
jgi:LRV iron-sulfur cluster protein/leucine rich repeat (LRR) protein